MRTIPLVAALLLWTAPALAQSAAPESKADEVQRQNEQAPQHQQALEQQQKRQRDDQALTAGQETRKQELATDPAVRNNQPPEPSPQGTRSPEVALEQPTAKPDLWRALTELRRAPPDLQGNPVPRPNDLASEPGPDAGAAR